MNSLDRNIDNLRLETKKIRHFSGVSIQLETSLDACEIVWKNFENESSHFVFQKYEWQRNFIDTIGAELKITPVVVLLRDSSGRLLMLWPLALWRRGPLRFLVPLGGLVTDYHAPMITLGALGVITPSVVEQILAKISNEIARYDVIEFDKMPDRIEDWENPIIKMSGVEPQGRNAHAARLGNDFETWVKTRRSSSVLKDERRSLRRLAEIASLSPRIDVEGAESGAIGEVLIAQKSTRWRKSGQIDLFERSGYREFYIRLITKQACRDESHVSALRLGDDFIACHFGMIYRNRFYYLLPTFALGPVDKFSPGNLLLLDLFRWCVANRITCFDFTVGDEGYKTAWCDVTLPLSRYVRARTALGRCYVLASRLIERARRVAFFRRLKRACRQRNWAGFNRLLRRVSVY